VRERHYTTASRGDTNRRVREGSAGNTIRPLHDDLAVSRVEDVPRDSSPVGVGIEADSGVERAPELTVGVHYLLHPSVVRVGARNNLSPGRVGGCPDEQLPAPGLAVEERCRLVV